MKNTKKIVVSLITLFVIVSIGLFILSQIMEWEIWIYLGIVGGLFLFGVSNVISFLAAHFMTKSMLRQGSEMAMSQTKESEKTLELVGRLSAEMIKYRDKAGLAQQQMSYVEPQKSVFTLPDNGLVIED